MTSFADGEGLLSPKDRQLWNFTYSVLLKYGVPIIFKLVMPNRSVQQNLMYEFYVPRDREDVAWYVMQEWKHEARESSLLRSGDGRAEWLFGTEVHVFLFDGVGFYTEYADIKKMSENMLLYMTAKLQNKDVVITDFSRGYDYERSN